MVEVFNVEYEYVASTVVYSKCAALPIVVLVIYLIVPDLRNIPGFKVCFVMVGFVITYICLLIEHDMALFGVILSMVCMNVMCYDCYMGSRVPKEEDAEEYERRRFGLSCVYGLGASSAIYLFLAKLKVFSVFPAILTLLSIINTFFLVLAKGNGLTPGKATHQFRFTALLAIVLTIKLTVGSIVIYVLNKNDVSEEAIEEVLYVFCPVMSYIVFTICICKSEIGNYFSKLFCSRDMFNRI